VEEREGVAGAEKLNGVEVELILGRRRVRVEWEAGEQ
jgi:hypothetical protein